MGTHAYVLQPLTLLAGDRNITNGLGSLEGCGPANLSSGAMPLDLTRFPNIRWTQPLHRYVGNVCQADGSVATPSQFKLKSHLMHDSLAGDPNPRARNHVLLP